MTDLELLQLAAKAAGLSVKWHESGHYGPTMEIMEDESGGPPWNPLTDDGDALRLAVRLYINIEDAVYAHCEQNIETYPNQYAVTRRAIVGAAAVIGEAMP